MKKGKIKALLVLLVIVLAGIYYYVTIPAINIHSTGIWIFILYVLRWKRGDCACDTSGDSDQRYSNAIRK